MHDNDKTTVNHISPMDNDMTIECRLCEVDMTDTKALQSEDEHCVRNENLLKDQNSKFPDRDIAMIINCYATKYLIWVRNT